MPFATSRRAILLAAPTATALPVGGGEERAWLSAVDQLAGKAEKAITATTTEAITRARLQSHASALGGYGRQLRRLGLPGGRLRPVGVLVKRARQQFGKGAACCGAAAGWSALAARWRPAQRADVRPCGRLRRRRWGRWPELSSWRPPPRARRSARSSADRSTDQDTNLGVPSMLSWRRTIAAG